ncbi:MAG: DUF86 domain-containing protein [Sedimentisphaerales bacterium]|nr:DUF86 domain-containing protein [Sedimentisphaerales bacterium]
MPNFNIRHEDKVRLRHMLDAALEIQQYVRSSTREDLDKDRKLVHSLVRLFEIIGEAAGQVSDELREDIPEIPWLVIIGMRNRLIHAYFEINLDIVWRTSTEDIPPLIEVLKEILD